MFQRVRCVSALHLLLLSLSPSVAALALSQEPLRSAVPPDVQQQIAALASEDASAVLGAAAKLGEMGPRASPAIPFLVPLLRDRGLETVTVGRNMISGFELTSEAVAGALARIGKPAIPPLDSLFSARESRDDATYWASVALLQMKDATATNVLLKKLATAAFPRRPQIARALWYSEDAQITRVVLGFLQDPDPKLRAAAVEGLTGQNNPQITDALVPRLKDENADVRQWAARAMKKAADPRTVDQLIQALTDSDDQVKMICADTLGAIRDKRAVEPLVGVVANDPDKWVRFHAGKALGAITGENFGEDGALWQKWWRERSPSSATGVAGAVTATHETQAAPSGEAADAQPAEVDPQHFLLTGTALHKDGTPWPGLDVVLFPQKSGQSQVGYGLNPETGQVELGNPKATTDAAGRVAIKVDRGYLDKKKEETGFRIGYVKGSRGQAALLIEMGKKGSKEPLALKIKKDVEKLDLGELW